MENWGSFLFGGTNFDRKKFAGVFGWFKFPFFSDKKETDSKVEDLPLFDNGSLEPEEPAVSIKKRKRKGKRGMAMQKRVKALHQLQHLLSRSEFCPVEAALKAGAIPLLVQCPSFGSPDEQV
ncbi:hypothetical protein SLEP1_g23434 [Rubroshorea leprosula]|uniref:Uncharacterized protein n=2 Tax=Rubroshorea leprosula TaxID=152421 RepID=A0AAV5JCD6_9ROSI|nr:hypothetical protein SLEP1_g23434 [Rubroshorea leprosula]